MPQFDAKLREFILCAPARTLDHMRQRVDALIEELEERGLAEVAADVRVLREDEPDRARDVHGLHSCEDGMYQTTCYQEEVDTPRSFAVHVVACALSHKIDLAYDAYCVRQGGLENIPRVVPYFEAFELAWAASDARMRITPTVVRGPMCTPRG